MVVKLLVLANLLFASCSGFIAGNNLQSTVRPSGSALNENVDVEEADETSSLPKLELFLEKKYNSFYQLLNEDMRKAIKEDKVTVFAPNDAAFEALGEKKLEQLSDPRNEEIREKMVCGMSISGSLHGPYSSSQSSFLAFLLFFLLVLLRALTISLQERP